jgi:hypothetical protein
VPLGTPIVLLSLIDDLGEFVGGRILCGWHVVQFSDIGGGKSILPALAAHLISRTYCYRILSRIVLFQRFLPFLVSPDKHRPLRYLENI